MAFLIYFLDPAELLLKCRNIIDTNLNLKVRFLSALRDYFVQLDLSFGMSMSFQRLHEKRKRKRFSVCKIEKLGIGLGNEASMKTQAQAHARTHAHTDYQKIVNDCTIGKELR